MENRRRGSQTIHQKPYRKKYPKRTSDSSTDNKGGYKSRNNKYKSNDGKYPKKEGGFQSRNNNYNPKKRFEKKGKGKSPWKKEQLVKIVSDKQITDGKHRGKYLENSDSQNAKPTIRRIREVMFRILFRRVRAGRFLDLCAGSGTVGLEAISRGSIVSTFVERKARLCSFIKKNMENLEINEGHGEVFEMEVVPFLKQMQKRRRYWDIVFFSPPYDGEYDDVLAYLERGVTVKPGGVVVIEHHSEMFFQERIGVLKRWRVIVEGDSAISFYSRIS